MPRSRIVLLVEDNEDDVFALRWALRKAQIDLSVQIAGDGQQAIDYLAGVGVYADRRLHPLPGLVLLDLKLPYRTGTEVLAWIRERPTLDEIPIVVLSGSDEPRDREHVSALGARDYLVKPPTAEDLRRILGQSHLLAN